MSARTENREKNGIRHAFSHAVLHHVNDDKRKPTDTENKQKPSSTCVVRHALASFYEDDARLVSHSVAFTMPERLWSCGVNDVLHAMKDSGDSDMPPATLRWAGPVLGE